MSRICYIKTKPTKGIQTPLKKDLHKRIYNYQVHGTKKFRLWRSKISKTQKNLQRKNLAKLRSSVFEI